MGNVSFVDNTKAAIRKITGESELPWMPRAQAVLKQAIKLARKDGFDIIGTEHILLGIVSGKEGIGARVLENLGLDSSKLHQHYKKLSRPSGEKNTGQSVLSEDIDKVIKCAYEQATQWGHSYIGTEHLLAGILLAGTGDGFQILTDLGITLEKVREETAKLVICQTKNEQ